MNETARHVTNIMFADVKGYSGLSEEQIFSFHQNLLPDLDRRIQGFKFEYARLWGDGIAIASISVKEIAKIATECRDFFLDRDYVSDGLPPLSIRISIHHGEYYKGTGVFSSNGEIFGKTIIQAARIEPITQPGRIWVTEAIHVALRDAGQGENEMFSTDEIGELELPKGYGKPKLWLLRRSREARLSEDEKQEIFQAAEHRRNQIRSKENLEPTGRFEVVVGLVLRNQRILLVRRNPDDSGLDWMFPSGKKLAVEDERAVVFKEVLDETGLACRVLKKLGTVDEHPLTGATCHYYLMKPVSNEEPQNLDPHENSAVRFVDVGDLETFIPGFIAPHVIDMLTDPNVVEMLRDGT